MGRSYEMRLEKEVNMLATHYVTSNPEKAMLWAEALKALELNYIATQDEKEDYHVFWVQSGFDVKEIIGVTGKKEISVTRTGLHPAFEVVNA